MRIHIFRSAVGAYRTQNIIKYFLDNCKNYQIFYRDVEYNNVQLFGNKYLTKFYRALHRYTFSFLEELVSIFYCDVFFIPAMQQRSSIFIKLARFLKKKIFIDFYISLYEMRVVDRGSLAKDSPEAQKIKQIERELLLKSDKVFFLNKSEADYYCQVLGVGIAQVKAEIVPLCVDQHPAAELDYFRGRKKVPVLCWWGSYVPLHGLDKIIKAMQILKQKNFPFLLYIVGSEQHGFQGFFKMVKDYGLSENVKFYFDERNWLKFVRQEGDLALGIFGDTKKSDRVFPNKVVDALSLSMPVITKSTGGQEELLQSENVLFLAENTPQGIAAKVIEVSQRKFEEIENIVGRGRDIYSKIFSPLALAEKLNRIFGR